MSVGAGRDWKSKKDKIDENIFSLIFVRINQKRKQLRYFLFLMSMAMGILTRVSFSKDVFVMKRWWKF